MLIPVPEHTHKHHFVTIITRVLAAFSSLHEAQPIRDTEALLRTGNQLHLSIPQRRRGQLKRDEVLGGTCSCLRERPSHVKVRCTVVDETTNGSNGNLTAERQNKEALKSLND